MSKNKEHEFREGKRKNKTEREREGCESKCENKVFYLERKKAKHSRQSGCCYKRKYSQSNVSKV